MNKAEAIALTNEMFDDLDFSTHVKTAKIYRENSGEYDPVTGETGEEMHAQWSGFLLPNKKGYTSFDANISSNSYDGEYYFLAKTEERPKDIGTEQKIIIDDAQYRILSIQDQFDVLTYLYLDVING